MTTQILVKDRMQLLKTRIFIYESLREEKYRLTKSELPVLLEFLALPKKFEHKRFSNLAKQRVAATLETTVINLNHKINSLLKKRFLKRDTDRVLYINDFLKAFVEEYHLYTKEDSMAMYVSIERRKETTSENK